QIKTTMKVRILLIGLYALITVTFIYAQTLAELSVNPCSQKASCGECVAAGGVCGWCKQDNFDEGNKERCDKVENLIKVGCDYSNIINPDHDMSFVKNDEVRNAEGSDDAVQLQPQEIKIKLRPNKPYTFKTVFRQAENYPVDLYYLMDLSFSMKDDKAKLAALGVLLADSMKNITSNFRIGFGSFVDKKAMPYVSTLPRKLANPCQAGEDCVSPYGFKNQLPLDDDPREFESRVKAAKVSGNLDSPEGGFDAIMQTITCETKIGWRPNSRKMLLFSTDAGFHYAGDGKLAGIVAPNDGQCHLDSTGEYDKSLELDYPSVSQITNMINDKKVNVIFAVTKTVLDTYKSLSDVIKGSSAGELANDSSNVVDLVKDNYNKITSGIELQTQSAENVTVTFKSKCFDNETRTRSRCEGLKIGGSVEFEVTVNVDGCPKNRNEWKRSLYITPVGVNERLKIDLDLMCECDCEIEGVGVPNSVHCNSSGTFECGACSCNPGRYGKKCECDGSDLTNDDYDAACRKTNTSSVCEGKGQCICGQCDCNPRSKLKPNEKYSGNFCDCDNYSCDYDIEGKLCGGEEKGRCECGTCMCNDGFKGSDCGCAVSDETCRASNGEICNGKGTCECGRCTCNKENYRGVTCEDCPTCPGKCEVNKACVQCKLFGTGDKTQDECDANCTHVRGEETAPDDADHRTCQFKDDDDCIFYFSYEYDGPNVIAQNTKKCPEEVDILIIVLAVIGGIVAVGLALLLIWKLFTTINDRREFAKFEKEKQNAKWDAGENPIYKQATSTFKNPTYGGQS
ncbi:unnamed protein product, partial [Owenia fusiformis]